MVRITEITTSSSFRYANPHKSPKRHLWVWACMLRQTNLQVFSFCNAKYIFKPKNLNDWQTTCGPGIWNLMKWGMNVKSRCRIQRYQSSLDPYSCVAGFSKYYCFLSHLILPRWSFMKVNHNKAILHCYSTSQQILTQLSSDWHNQQNCEATPANSSKLRLTRQSPWGAYGLKYSFYLLTGRVLKGYNPFNRSRCEVGGIVASRGARLCFCFFVPNVFLL